MWPGFKTVAGTAFQLSSWNAVPSLAGASPGRPDALLLHCLFKVGVYILFHPQVLLAIPSSNQHSTLLLLVFLVFLVLLVLLVFLLLLMFFVLLSSSLSV